MSGILTMVSSLCISLFPVVCGILIIMYSKRSRRKKLQKYSCQTSAKIVEIQNTTRLKYQNSRNNYTDGYAPVYEYYYCGQYYTVVSKYSTSNTNLQIGSFKTIYIDPRNPWDIYEPDMDKVFSTLGVIVGVILIIVSIMPLLFNIAILAVMALFTS